MAINTKISQKDESVHHSNFRWLFSDENRFFLTDSDAETEEDNPLIPWLVFNVDVVAGVCPLTLNVDKMLPLRVVHNKLNIHVKYCARREMINIIDL